MCICTADLEHNQCYVVVVVNIKMILFMDCSIPMYIAKLIKGCQAMA